MKIKFCTKDARRSLIEAVCGILEQDAVYDGKFAATHAAGGYIVKCTAKKYTAKGGTHVNIRFNVTGAGRRAFAQAVGEILGYEAVYSGTPTFAYSVGGYTIDREGALICPAVVDCDEADRLIAALGERGYVSVPDKTPTPEPYANANDSDKLTVEMPDISQAALSSLRKIIASKETLIKRALGADSLHVEADGSKLRFPWFTLTGTDGEMDAYTRFIAALCQMAKKQKRVTATERDTGNDKFAMRIFLIRLGFVGPEFKTARKILLRNLEGNSSWKNGQPPKPAKDKEI